MDRDEQDGGTDTARERRSPRTRALTPLRIGAAEQLATGKARSVYKAITQAGGSPSTARAAKRNGFTAASMLQDYAASHLGAESLLKLEDAALSVLRNMLEGADVGDNVKSAVAVKVIELARIAKGEDTGSEWGENPVTIKRMHQAMRVSARRALVHGARLALKDPGIVERLRHRLQRSVQTLRGLEVEELMAPRVMTYDPWASPAVHVRDDR